MQTVSKQPTEQPPPHWTDEEKDEFYAKLEAANRARQLDWYDDTFSQSLKTCGAAALGVVMAGGVFPIVLSLCGMAFVLYDQATHGDSFVPVVGVLIFGLIFCVFGMTAAVLAQFFAKYLLATFNSWLGFPIKARRQILMTGGLSGFLCLGWVTAIPIGRDFPPDAWQGIVIFLFFVFFGMLHCQVGALWSAGRNDSWFDTASPLAMKRTDNSDQPKQLPVSEALLDNASVRSPVRDSAWDRCSNHSRSYRVHRAANDLDRCRYVVAEV